MSISSNVTAAITVIAAAINARMGKTGASAYEIAVLNGYGGTQAQWLAMLQSQLVGINPQTASYTAVLADAGQLITETSSSATTVTLPTNATVPYPLTTVINFANLGSGAMTIAGAAGVTVLSPQGARITTANGQASAIKIATNTWLLSGNTVV